MEKEVTLKSEDGHTIYGLLSEPSRKTDKLLILIHGFACTSNDHIHYNAARFFPKRNINVFRFDLYSNRPNARKLKECTLSIHGKDITTVISHFKEKFNKIYLAGHSYGGTSILFANTSHVSAGVFWDGTYTLDDILTGCSPDKNYGYVLDWLGHRVILEKKIADEGVQLKNASQLIQNLRIPIKFIVAGKSEGSIAEGNSLMKYANTPKDIVIIKKATHWFDEEGTEEELFNETLRWIKKF